MIYGDGEQTRDFVYAGDVVKANILDCESGYNGVVNVASGKSVTNNELYGIISDTLGSDLKPKYCPKRQGNINHSLADVGKMEKINFNIDSSGFEKHLVETVNWFKSTF